MTLTDPRTTLNEFLAAVTAVKLPIAFGDPAPAAFASVKLFDLQDLPRAMEELFVYGDRIALIALTGSRHSTTVSGRTLTVARTLSIQVLLSDRRFSDRQIAMMGDATTPGAILLSNQIINALAGELPSGAVIQPADGELIDLRSAERDDQTGRIIYSQAFTAHDAWDATTLTRKAKVSAT